jgi:hypothetical protein
MIDYYALSAVIGCIIGEITGIYVGACLWKKGKE